MKNRRTECTAHHKHPSFIRTVTVGSGFTPDLLTHYKVVALAGLFTLELTAGGEFHSALKV